MVFGWGAKTKDKARAGSRPRFFFHEPGKAGVVLGLFRWGKFSAVKTANAKPILEHRTAINGVRAA